MHSRYLGLLIESAFVFGVFRGLVILTFVSVILA